MKPQLTKELTDLLVTVNTAATLQKDGVSGIQFEGMLQGILSHVLTLHSRGRCTALQYLLFKEGVSSILRQNNLVVSLQLSFEYDIVFVTKSEDWVPDDANPCFNVPKD